MRSRCRNTAMLWGVLIAHGFDFHDGRRVVLSFACCKNTAMWGLSKAFLLGAITAMLGFPLLSLTLRHFVFCVMQ